MQLSLHSDFSLRVLMYLALKTEERVSIEEIARAYRISTNHLVKVVHNLGRLGLIETTRGRGGGLRLAKPADQIGIGDTIRKTEKLVLLECFAPETSECPITGICLLRDALKKAKEAFLITLDDYTLADITKNSRSLGRRLIDVGDSLL